MKAPEQVSDVILWMDAQYDIVCVARGWPAMSFAERLERLLARMDDRGRALNIDTLDVKSWAKLMPMLDQRAMTRALADGHRLMAETRAGTPVID